MTITPKPLDIKRVGLVLIENVNPELQTKIQELIKKLGSSDFSERDSATKELEKIGRPALSALRKASNSGDPEMKLRAANIFKKIQKTKKISGVSPEENAARKKMLAERQRLEEMKRRLEDLKRELEEKKNKEK